MERSVALLSATALVLISMSSANDEPVVDQRPRDFSLEILKLKEAASAAAAAASAAAAAAPADPADPAVSQDDVAPELSTGGGSIPALETPSVGITLDYPVQFPPARPSSANLQAICFNGDNRPRYPDSYFPASGYGSLKRRAEAVNKAESWFSTCCERNETWAQEWTLCCATQAWELALNSFCEEDASKKDRVHECCKLLGDQILDCFQKDAPNPNYEPTEEQTVPPLPFEAIFNFDNRTCQG